MVVEDQVHHIMVKRNSGRKRVKEGVVVNVYYLLILQYAFLQLDPLQTNKKIYTPKEGYGLFIHMMLGVYTFLITTLGGYIVDWHLDC